MPRTTATAPAGVGPQPGGGTDTTEGLGTDHLLTQVATGSTDAFSALYRRVAPEVLAVARRIVRSDAMAEEVAHDALLSVWLHSASFDSSRGTARTWIRTIAHRRAVDVVRSEQAGRNRLAREAAEPAPPPRDDVAHVVALAMEAEQVRHAVRDLTPLQGEAIELAYLHGLTRREVALHLAIPIGTAKSRIDAGLRELRRRLPPSR